MPVRLWASGPWPPHLLRVGGTSGGPVIKNLPANAGDTGLIPGLGTKIPDAKGQPSWSVTTTETALWSPGAKTTEARTR